jgi:hypothetical protein
MMQDPFAQRYALANQQIQFAAALKAKTLTVVPNSNLGQLLATQNMFSSSSSSSDDAKQ